MNIPVTRSTPSVECSVLTAPAPWWNLESTAVSDRTDAWQQVLSDCYRDWQVPQHLPTTFRARLQRRDLDGIDWVECLCDPCAGQRTPQQLRHADGAAFVGVQFVVDGRERFNTTGGQIEVRRGDVVVWTTDQAVDFEVMESLHKLTLVIPWSALQQHLPQRRQMPVGGKLDTRSGAGALLAAHLQALPGSIDTLNAGLRRAASRWTVDLLAAALTPVQSASRRQCDVALLRQVQMQVMESLYDNELTPSRIAAAHRMSLRHLHLLFQRAGLTVSGWIQEQRLQRCRDALLDPAYRQHHISEIAYRWGFVSAPHFSRAFRDRFGVSPREMRESVSVSSRTPAVLRPR